MPAEKPLDRQIVVVVGAGSGIGRGLLARLVSEGATSSRSTATRRRDRRRGRCQKKVAWDRRRRHADLRRGPGDRARRRHDRPRGDPAGAERGVLAYGGIDQVVVTAGYYPNPDDKGEVGDHEWARAFAINVTGPYLVADEAYRLEAAGARGRPRDLHERERRGAEGRLVRVRHEQGGGEPSRARARRGVRPLVRVNGIAPATVIEGSSMFPRERVLASLAKYKVEHDPTATTEELRDRLAAFYAKRTLTGQPVTLDSQIRAITAFLDGNFSKTTGQIVNVDGGQAAAFLR